MSLSVSSFPEATPTLVRQPKWQVTPSLKISGRFLGTLLSKRSAVSKRSVPFLKGIGHFAKTHVKGNIIRQRANVLRLRSLSKYHSFFSRTSIRSSSPVIDITPSFNIDKYFSARSSDVDASSLNPTIEISFSPDISPAVLSTPTAAMDVLVVSPKNPVKAPFQPSLRSLAGNRDSAHEIVLQHPAKEHEEVATESDSEPHDPQPPNSEITTPLPISSSLTQSLAVPVPGRRRSHSASAGDNASVTKAVPPTLPRYKSETAIGLRRLTSMTPSGDPSSSEGKDTSRGENPIPQPPSPATAGSTHTSESTPMTKQRQQRHETISKRARTRSDASSKSAGSNKTVESPPPSAHIFNVRSAGSHLSANSPNHRPSTAPPPQSFSLNATALVPKSLSEKTDLFPKTGDVAAESDDTPEQSPPLLSSVDRGLWLRLAAVPHAEPWDGERQRRRPRTAPEAVLMGNW